MKAVLLFFIFFLPLYCSMLNGQYTDQINSNRPGASIGAFSVGKKVFHLEAGVEHRGYRHVLYKNSSINGQVYFMSLRWGLLREQLEVNYEGSYFKSILTSRVTSTPSQLKLEGFLSNFIGIKYLIFDPFKRGEKTNVYSWKANNVFKLRHLIPAVSLTGGANFNLNPNNPFRFGDIYSILDRPIFFQNVAGFPFDPPLVNFKGTLATQSHFLPKWVFVTNFSYTSYPNRFRTLERKEYVLTLTHNFHPDWSVYVEHQAIFYPIIEEDFFFRSGMTFLANNNLHFEATAGLNHRTTPALYFFNLGVSFRLSNHESTWSLIEYNARMDAKAEKRKARKDAKKEAARSRNRKKVQRLLQKRNSP